MTTYILLGSWTDHGIEHVTDSPKRLDKTKSILREMGGEVQAFYLTMGEYDFIMVIEAPDDAIAARFALMTGTLGFVRTTTLKAFPEAAFREIIKSMG
jgi:uncharacterized protein with GYD domain